MAHQSGEGEPTHFYMHFDLSDKGIQMKIEHYEDITIYVSQTDMMPSQKTRDALIYHCSKDPNECIVDIEPSILLEDNKDLHITIVANKTI